MLERINRIIEEKQMSTTQFADFINIQRPTMSHIISGRNNPSLDIVMKILTAFPDIDSDWLMFGDGKMYKAEISKEEISNELPDKPALNGTKQTSGMMDLFSMEETAEESEEREIEEIHQDEVKSSSQESILNIDEEKSELLPNLKDVIGDEEMATYYKSKTAISDSPESSTNTNVRIEPENHQQKKEKQIRKIVFFYADKSFSEYYPRIRSFFR
ncbi:MAG: helix-turn-helix transcriptional regulator [Bacteroidales bacterium]|nr:helix-turn-helix transcriptional regulator [Bacteroidales bacterium]